MGDGDGLFGRIWVGVGVAFVVADARGLAEGVVAPLLTAGVGLLVLDGCGTLAWAVGVGDGVAAAWVTTGEAKLRLKATVEMATTMHVYQRRGPTTRASVPFERGSTV
ncbi:MAG: hypothetical protein ABI352_08380 [Candidatus Dormibacter sp.]